MYILWVHEVLLILYCEYTTKNKDTSSVYYVNWTRVFGHERYGIGIDYSDDI